MVVESSEITVSNLFERPFSLISQDWYGAPVKPPLQFVLVSDSKNIGFAVKVSQRPDYDAGLHKGSFRAELWKRTVAEFFLREDSSMRYQEFNLSPAGAWWSGGFLSPRRPDPNFQAPKSVEIAVEVFSDSWQAAMVIPRAELSVSCNFSGITQANVCFILGTDDQYFYSLSKLPGEKPDFHQPQYFDCKLLNVCLVSENR